MRIITVKGFSKTGKTTTVVSLVSELRRRGYTVGTVKDIHFKEFEADTPGTDTYKHASAGARRVTARGPKNTGIIMDERMTMDAILKYYKEDFVIIEGDCGIDSPTIITAKTINDIEEKMCYYKKVYNAKFSVGAVGYFKFGAVDFSPEKLLKMPNKCCIFQIKCYYVY